MMIFMRDFTYRIQYCSHNFPPLPHPLYQIMALYKRHLYKLCILEMYFVIFHHLSMLLTFKTFCCASTSARALTITLQQTCFDFSNCLLVVAIIFHIIKGWATQLVPLVKPCQIFDEQFQELGVLFFFLPANTSST